MSEGHQYFQNRRAGRAYPRERLKSKQFDRCDDEKGHEIELSFQIVSKEIDTVENN